NHAKGGVLFRIAYVIMSPSWERRRPLYAASCPRERPPGLAGCRLAERVAVLGTYDGGRELARQHASDDAAHTICEPRDVQVPSHSERLDTFRRRLLGRHQPPSQRDETFAGRHLADQTARSVSCDGDAATTVLMEKSAPEVHEKSLGCGVGGLVRDWED